MFGSEAFSRNSVCFGACDEWQSVQETPWRKCPLRRKLNRSSLRPCSPSWHFRQVAEASDEDISLNERILAAAALVVSFISVLASSSLPASFSFWICR